MSRAAGALSGLTWIMALLLCGGCGGDDQGSDPDDDAATGDAATGDTAGGDGPDAGAGANGDGDATTDAGPDPLDAAMDELPPAPDEQPPTLVSTTPTDGDDNVAADVAPVLVFSEPVELGADALTLTQVSPAAGALGFTTAQSADGETVTLTLDQPLEPLTELTLTIGPGITDMAGNPLEPVTLRFQVPIWLRLGESLNRDPLVAASDVRLALDDQARPIAASVENGEVHVDRFEDGAWQPLGGALNQTPALASPRVEPRLALVVDDSGAPIVAFRQAAGVVVVRWDGASFQPAGDAADPLGGGSYAPALTLATDGAPIVAFDAQDGSAQPVLRLRALNNGSWQTLADLAVDSRGARLANQAAGQPALAYLEDGAGIFVSRWDGGGLVALGAGAALPEVSGSFSLDATGAQTYALSAQGEGTHNWGAGAWTPVTQELGFNNSSDATERSLSAASDGALSVAFAETAPGEVVQRVYVQRQEGSRFQPLGPVLARDRSARAGAPALATAASGQPIVAWVETPADAGAAQIFVSRFNGDPAAPPVGLRERVHDAACLASAPVDGSLLTDTACFADGSGREPVAGFIPFDVRSPLWTDGAFKRRFFMLPEGATITYRDPGIWTFPDGTILIKEFAIEGVRGDPGTIRPVETRFLVVRDSGEWDRYSYQWNQAATEAVLRVEAPATSEVDFAIEDESGSATTQTHFYPSRAACLGCHQTPGTVLGPQSAMLNRNLDYGVTVDNQLRTMQRLGLFGTTFAAADLPQARSMPNPLDTTHTTERRLRAYLHANCSSCHRPTEGMDLRIQTATLDTGLCSKITKGDLDASIIYWRDVLRGNPGQPGVAPMPPLGTLVANPALEPLLTDWILDADNPCP